MKDKQKQSWEIPRRGALVEAVTKEGLDNYLDKNPQDARNICEKILLAAKARKAAKAAAGKLLFAKEQWKV